MNNKSANLRVVNGGESVKKSLSDEFTLLGEEAKLTTRRYNIPYSPSFLETAAGRGDEHMDESTKIILDRIDKDIREHKQETRDRDARLQSEMQEREKELTKKQQQEKKE